MTQTGTTKTIKQIDAELAIIYAESATVRRAQIRNADEAHSMVSDRKIGRGRDIHWQLTDDVVFEMVEARAEDTTYPVWTRNILKGILAKRVELDNQHTRLAIRASEYDAEYNSRPWSRFFVVTSSAGHIHSSTGCQTCNPATTYRWLFDLSGDTEEDAVRAHGPNLCSICFPSAPLAWTVGSKASKPRCAGTSQLALNITWVGDRRYGTCRCCGERHQVNSNGKPRAHK